MVRQDIFQQTCSQGYFSKIKRISINHCKYLHHNDNHLKIGPVKLEVLRRFPFVSIFHDLMNEKEIDWLIRESSPNLSASRTALQYQGGKVDRTTKITEKTVQTWMQEFNLKSSNMSYERFRPQESQVSIRHPILYKLSKKIEMVTKLEMRYPTSTSKTQITNYGLAGLCEVHNDPSGYNEGRQSAADSHNLIENEFSCTVVILY